MMAGQGTSLDFTLVALRNHQKSVTGTWCELMDVFVSSFWLPC